MAKDDFFLRLPHSTFRGVLKCTEQRFMFITSENEHCGRYPFEMAHKISRNQHHVWLVAKIFLAWYLIWMCFLDKIHFNNTQIMLKPVLCKCFDRHFVSCFLIILVNDTSNINVVWMWLWTQHNWFSESFGLHKMGLMLRAITDGMVNKILLNTAKSKCYVIHTSL